MSTCLKVWIIDNCGVYTPLCKIKVPVMRFTITTGEIIGDIIGGEYNLTGNDEDMVIRNLSNINWKLDVVCR